MGLAEKSDALILVVSEERGTISVFKNAAYSIITEGKQIEAAICDHWNQMAAFPVDIPTSSIRWPAFLQALASLAAAVVFWGAITVGQGEVIEKAISVPVE